MLFYFTLFLAFLYFKIARVNKKEERQTSRMLTQNFVVAISTTALLVYGISHIEWYLLILSSFIFFISAALMITAIQLGIFVDGKPTIKLSKVYFHLPFLTTLIAGLTLVLWIF
jgi:glucan phosphoethanolaminetransferase (alkaline phosphatase superfamily)